LHRNISTNQKDVVFEANDKIIFACSMFILFVFFISVHILRCSFHAFDLLIDKFVIHFKVYFNLIISGIWQTYIAFWLVGHNVSQVYLKF